LLRNQVMLLRREVADLKLQLERRDLSLQHQLRSINMSIGRMANAPGRTINSNGNNLVAEDKIDNVVVAQEETRNGVVAELSKLPKTLHALWDEYDVGSPGKKPAKEFTKAERGKTKHKFYLRKFLWDQVSEMVRSGMDSKDACDKIYTVYGKRESVTKILRALQRDKKTGGHPNLRIRRLLLH
jgi:hypothetical protein